MSYMGLVQRPAEESLAVSTDCAAWPRAYWVGWLSVMAAVPVAAMLLIASRMHLVIGSILPLTILTILLGCVHVVYGQLRPDKRLSLCSGMLAMLIASAILAAIISHAGLRVGFPFVDTALSTADDLLGIDTPQLALALALNPMWGEPLKFMYASCFPVMFVAAMFLGFHNKEERAWELASCFSVCIIAASIASVCFPAIGSMVYHHIDSTKGLPNGAGNFYLATVQYFRDGQNPAFDFAKLNGVVTMPSFHMVMALLVPYALRGTGMVGWIAAVWSVLVMLSTIAYGGHYVIDLIAGAGLWAFAAWLVRTRATTRHLGVVATGAC